MTLKRLIFLALLILSLNAHSQTEVESRFKYLFQSEKPIELKSTDLIHFCAQASIEYDTTSLKNVSAERILHNIETKYEHCEIISMNFWYEDGSLQRSFVCLVRTNTKLYVTSILNFKFASRLNGELFLINRAYVNWKNEKPLLVIEELKHINGNSLNPNNYNTSQEYHYLINSDAKFEMVLKGH